MIVYMVTNKVNGKEYIGQTIYDLDKRRREHISAALTKNNNNCFHSAIRKYGVASFEWTILHGDITDIDFLNRLEIFYIGYYDTFLGDGYNLMSGGLNANHSEESKLKMSEAKKGIKFTKEHCLNMSKARMDHWNCGEKHWNYGKSTSIETKKKMSESRIGKCCGKDNPSARAVIINDKYFDTVIGCAVYLNIHKETVRRRILHKTKWTDYQYA